MASGLPLLALLVVCSLCFTASAGRPPVKTILPVDDPELAKRRCEPGWERHRQRCFKHFSVSKSWFGAERYCGIQGGYLASIHSSDENDFVNSLNKEARAWIGGNDADSEGLWSWSDNSNFYYNQWASGEPNNLAGNEDCMEITFPNGDWKDSPCRLQLYFICAKRL